MLPGRAFPEDCRSHRQGSGWTGGDRAAVEHVPAASRDLAPAYPFWLTQATPSGLACSPGRGDPTWGRGTDILDRRHASVGLLGELTFDVPAGALGTTRRLGGITLQPTSAFRARSRPSRPPVLRVPSHLHFAFPARIATRIFPSLSIGSFLSVKTCRGELCGRQGRVVARSWRGHRVTNRSGSLARWEDG